MTLDWRNLGAILVDSIRADLVREHLETIGPTGILLDVGCGTRPYRSLYERFVSRSVGIDLPTTDFPQKDVDVFCSVTELSRVIERETADVVLCAEVLHDIPDPAAALEEIFCVLRPGGTLLLTTPFMVPICDGRYDHYRYTAHGLRHLLTVAGFEVLSIRPVGDVFAVPLMFTLKPVLRFWNRLLKTLRLSRFYSPFNPFIFVTAVLPQLTYVLYDAASRSSPGLRSVRARLEYGPVGYVSMAVRPFRVEPERIAEATSRVEQRHRVSAEADR